MSTIKLIRGDSLAVLRLLDDESIHSIVTDPPYGLSKEPDMAEVLTHWLAGDDYEHRGRGFMGKQWDSFVPGPSVWRECLRVLKPGGHLLCFAGSRTVDLMGVSIRLAGFEIRDQMQWLYGCLTEDAEILTENGWKLGVDVEVGERVAQWDPESEAITLAEVEHKTLAPYSGPMRVLSNADTRQVLTPNHRVYHRTQARTQVDGLRTTSYGESWSVAEASDVTRYAPTQLPLSGHHDGSGIGGEDYAALLGWVWTEGGFDKTGSGVRLYQSPSANPVKVKEIDALIERIGITASRYERERTYRYKDTERPYTEVCWFFTGEWAQRVRADLPDKAPNYDLLWAMTSDEKQSFYDAAMKGDGSGMAFYQKDPATLEWFQVLLATIGKRGRINPRKASVSIANRGMTEMQHRHFVAAPDEHYEGDVWCVTVPTGAFVARLDGKVFITGNSGFPKSMDVSKAIDKQGQSIKLLPVVRSHIVHWLNNKGLTNADLNEAMGFSTKGSGMASHWTDHPTQAQIPSKGQWVRLKEVLGWPDCDLDAVYDTVKDGAQRPVVRLSTNGIAGGTGEHVGEGGAWGFKGSFEMTGPATDEAAQWEGWGSALKPAHEPIIVARKPLSVNGKKATVAKNVLEHGTGAINIDGSRIGMSDEDREKAKVPTGEWTRSGTTGATDRRSGEQFDPAPGGRWPANVLFAHHEECVQVGMKKVKGSVLNQVIERSKSQSNTYAGGKQQTDGYCSGFTDENGNETVEAWKCHEDCPVAILDAQSGTGGTGTGKAKVSAGGAKRTASQSLRQGSGMNVPGKVNVGVRDFGDTGGASRFFYCAKAPKSERNAGMPEGTVNKHPTVKPVKLMEYLVRMVTPPGGTVLDPYMGSGTTMVATANLGFDGIGIDLDEDGGYLPIAEHRVRTAEGVTIEKMEWYEEDGQDA